MQKWQYLKHSWLSHHQFLHFHTSIFDTKKFVWQNLPCQEKRRCCNSSRSPPSYRCCPIFLSSAATSSERQTTVFTSVVSSDQLFSHISLDSAGNKGFRTWAVTRAMAASNKCGGRRQLWIIPGKKQSRNNFILLVKIQLYLTILNEYNSISQTQRIQMERGTRRSEN